MGCTGALCELIHIACIHILTKFIGFLQCWYIPVSTFIQMYSRPSHSPHTLSPTGPRPHTLTRSGRPSRRLSSPLLDDSMATLSDISLQLSLYEDPSNLAEMIHVRSNVTTAEFYNLQLENRKDFKNIQDEKV